MKTPLKESAIIGFSLFLLAGLLLLDISTPLGLADRILYAVVILVIAASGFPWLWSVTAGIATIYLIAMGGFFLGLTAALKHMADEWSAKTGIRMVPVQEELIDPLPHDIASCLYRVAQDSLANIMKHARAARVEIELTCDKEEITLSIYDAGVGFDLKEIRARLPGLGLVNMRERVRSARGRLDIQSELGRGIPNHYAHSILRSVI